MMTRENILLFKNMNMTRYTSIIRKVVLTMITLMTLGVGEMWGQIPELGEVVTFHNTHDGVSMAYENTQVNNKDWFCQTKTTNDADPKQQWVIEDEKNGSFYLKNIGTKSYLYQKGVEGNKDVWSFGFTTETSEYQTPKGKYTITLTGENYLIHLNSKGANEYLGLNTNKAPSNVIFADKTTSNGYVYWQIGLPAPVISVTDGNISITCPNTTVGVSIHYTTDGTDPTSESTTYNGSSFSIPDDCKIIKAIAVKDGYVNSTITQWYNTTIPWLFQNVEDNSFYMIPGDADNSGNTTVNTTSLGRASMSWSLVDAGIINGVQYYTIELS